MKRNEEVRHARDQGSLNVNPPEGRTPCRPSGGVRRPPRKHKRRNPMETKRPSKTVKIAIVEWSTPEEIRAFFGGEVVIAKVVELPVEEQDRPARILPFPRRDR